MKKVLAVLLLTVLVLSMCACTKTGTTDNGKPSETKAADCEHEYTGTVTKQETCQEEGIMTYTCSKCKDTYTEAIATQAHIYLDADCTTAKTCVNCNTTQGRAKGHDYIQGVCSRCEGEQPGYKSLQGNTWQTMGKTFAEFELDVVKLCFEEEGAYLRAEFYGLLSDLSAEEQAKIDPDSLIEFKRNKYYYKGFGETCPITYEEEDNIVTIEIVNGKSVGYIVMERKSVDKYTVTELTGIVFDNIITSCIEVGSTFQVVE